MTYLTRRENELIQLYLDAATEQLRHMGLVIETGHDLRECRAAYYEIPGHSKYPNTHDPDRCYLTPSNSFWVSFVDQVSTKPVVIGAQRIIETRSIISEI